MWKPHPGASHTRDVDEVGCPKERWNSERRSVHSRMLGILGPAQVELTGLVEQRRLEMARQVRLRVVDQQAIGSTAFVSFEEEVAADFMLPSGQLVLPRLLDRAVLISGVTSFVFVKRMPGQARRASERVTWWWSGALVHSENRATKTMSEAKSRARTAFWAAPDGCIAAVGTASAEQTRGQSLVRQWKQTMQCRMRAI